MNVFLSGVYGFALAAYRDGRYLVLGDAVLGGDNQAWGRQIPIDLSVVHELRFVGPDGQATFAATLDAASPVGVTRNR